MMSRDESSITHALTILQPNELIPLSIRMVREKDKAGRGLASFTISLYVTIIKIVSP